MTTADRLSMPLGESIFTQRAIRRFKPDPIPEEDLRAILESAIRGAQRWEQPTLALPGGEGRRAKDRVGGIVPRGLVGQAQGRGHQWTRRYTAGQEQPPLGHAPFRRVCPRAGRGDALLHLSGQHRFGDSRGPKPAAGGACAGGWRDHHDVARPGERASPPVVWNPGRRPDRLLPSAGIPQGQFWSGATQGAE